jgi:histidinol-phosphate aminotransferase
VRANAKKVILERDRLRAELQVLGIYCADSQANFLLATIPDTIKFSAAELYQKLKDRHVLVRYFNAQRLDNKLRVSIGTGEENDQLLSTLVDILKQS